MIKIGYKFKKKSSGFIIILQNATMMANANGNINCALTPSWLISR